MTGEAQARELLERLAIDASESAGWEVRKLVDELSKGGRHDAAVTLGKSAIELLPDFRPLSGAVAWALYRRDLSTLSDETTREDRAKAKASLQQISDLTSDEPYGRYSAFPRAHLALAKIAVKRWPAACLEILSELDPSKLSEESSGDYPSDKARWYLFRTKALAELGKWTDLRTCCQEAGERVHMQPKDFIWIRRREALALEGLGQPGEAAAKLKPLLSEMNEWWLWADYARIALAAGQVDEAEIACRLALEERGKLSFRWKTIHTFGRVCMKNHPDLAAELLLLARNLRKEEGWPPDPELESDWTELGKIVRLPEKYDEKKLRSTWQPLRERMGGVIKTLLEGGGSGFIKTDAGQDIYFGLPKGAAEAPPVGARVTFICVEGFDKKKQQASKKASDIRLAE